MKPEHVRIKNPGLQFTGQIKPHLRSVTTSGFFMSQEVSIIIKPLDMVQQNKKQEKNPS
jgi:inner membrane protein involved in colicin E2 resistance